MYNTSKTIGIIIISAALAACGGQELPGTKDRTLSVQVPHGATKADGFLTCQGHCGGEALGCWCDDGCEAYGDCCPDKPQICDGVPPPDCTGNEDCATGAYCHFEDGACRLPTFNILTGECKTMPEACYAVAAPVCGCDDVTYGNDCEAHAAGVSVAYDGECRKVVKACGPWPGGQCAADEVCNMKTCAVGGSGTCEKRPDPDQCYQLMYTLFEPVCGCDGVTYPDDCLRLAAGVALDHAGECDTEVACHTLTEQSCYNRLDCDWITEPGFPGPISHCVDKQECWGAWLDQNGLCRTPADGVYPDYCCDGERANRCLEIDQDYREAVISAKSCSPYPTFAPQCTFEVPNALSPCFVCKTFINSSPATLQPIKDQWTNMGCDNMAWACPAFYMPCPEPTGGSCELGINNESSCQDVY